MPTIFHKTNRLLHTVGIVCILVVLSIFLLTLTREPKLVEHTDPTIATPIEDSDPHQWPTSMPADIPLFADAHIVDTEDLSMKQKPSYQEHKILFILELSDITDQEIETYMAALAAKEWTTTNFSSSIKMPSLKTYRASNNKYIIDIENNIRGKNSAYFTVLSLTE
jgi:hypothetical protein